MSKQAEMEEIYESYEWLIKERLEQLDVLARNMFSEMGTFGIPKVQCDSFVQEKFKILANEVIEKGRSNQ
jgi:hypothetical protein